MRAEKVFVEPPSLVGRGGEGPGKQMLFVLAQARRVAEFFEDSGDFFFHRVKLCITAAFVEHNSRGGGVRER